MRAKIWTPVLLGASFLAIGFNNCMRSDLQGKGFIEQTSQTSTGEDDEAEPDGDLDSLCKVSIAATPAAPADKVASDLKTGTHAVGTKLMILVDNDCYKVQAGQSWITQKLQAQNLQLRPGKSTATSLTLDQPTSGESLTQTSDADKCVMQVDRDVVFSLKALPNDPYYASDQRYLKTIKHDQVVEKIFNPANGINQVVKVAVIDSGVDVNHPDLQALFLKDSQGKLIGLNGMDNSTDVLDSGFHGTHVTGMIAATANNAMGISGVLGQNIKVLPVKTSPDGNAIDLSALVNGIRWAADGGADVINMSLGGPQDRPAMRDAVAYAVSKGVFIAVASGNAGKVIGSEITSYPAQYSALLNGMVTVGSIDAGTGAISSFSNVSPAFVDLLAPGSDGNSGIISTVPANLSTSGYGRLLVVNGTAHPIQGTSMATPLVSGAAAAAIALARSRGYDAIPSQIEQLLDAGSPSQAALMTYARSGHTLDLEKLMATIDQDTQLNLSTTTNRSQARGVVTISQQPQSVDVSKGSPIQLSVLKSSNSSILVNYQWYKNGMKINGANQPTLNFASASLANVGQYHVVLRAGTTQVQSQKATVKVDGQACP